MGHGLTQISDWRVRALHVVTRVAGLVSVEVGADGLWLVQLRTKCHSSSWFADRARLVFEEAYAMSGGSLAKPSKFNSGAICQTTLSGLDSSPLHYPRHPPLYVAQAVTSCQAWAGVDVFTLRFFFFLCLRGPSACAIK